MAREASICGRAPSGGAVDDVFQQRATATVSASVPGAVMVTCRTHAAGFELPAWRAANEVRPMIRRSGAVLIAVAAVWLLPTSTMGQAKASTLDTAKAKAFIGEWVLTIEGRRGPQERPLSITDVGGKVAAELAGGRGGPVTITDITMPGSDLVLKWMQQGPQGEIDIVMTLTLKDGGLVVKQEIAGGQFSASGTGKKKG